MKGLKSAPLLNIWNFTIKICYVFCLGEKKYGFEMVFYTAIIHFPIPTDVTKISSEKKARVGFEH